MGGVDGWGAEGGSRRKIHGRAEGREWGSCKRPKKERNTTHPWN